MRNGTVVDVKVEDQHALRPPVVPERGGHNIKGFQSRGHNLALTVLCVPCFLEGGNVEGDHGGH